ncbi:MAG TPA: SGNH/GDSL hydrolase family protein [Candidatus Sumerlaeota bacterium]|nr:SGNH/GDSL hydrolase family protein [Candidatus Sumerlaeota bacterium]
MLVEAGSRILFTGDSITDAGRARPVGEGAGLGDGYVALMDALFTAVCPERRLHVLNTGIGGNTSRDLLARWQSDVVDLEPEWLCVMIGVNDAFYQQAEPPQPERSVDEAEFEANLRRAIEPVRPALRGLVLMTPFYLERDRKDRLRAAVDRYGEIVLRLAREFDAVGVDTQAAFDAVMAVTPEVRLADDKVHPNRRGQMIIARAIAGALRLPPGS